MPQDANGEIKVRLGVLSHADVGLPGRQLVRHPAYGWVSVPVQRGRFEFVMSRAGLGVVAGMAVMVLILAALAWRKPWVAMRDGTRDETAELPRAVAAAGTGHAHAALVAASAVALNSASAVASNAEPSGSASPPLAGGQRAPAGAPAAGLPGGPRPAWAASPGATGGSPRDLRNMTSSADSSQVAASSAPVRAIRKPPRAVAPRSSGRDSHTSVAKAPSADGKRRVSSNEADAAQGIASNASSASSAPSSHAVFNEGTAPPAARADVLVAITDANTIVVPGTRGLPAAFRVGERLPSGARLLTVDPRGGEAQTDRGVIRLQ